VKARARVVAASDGRGGTRLVTLRSEAPLVLRSTPGALYLVGGAGGPLGGDDLTLDIDVGPGASLTLRTAAASLAQPGEAPGPSRIRVRAGVGDGGELRWLPEPVVAVRGCVHLMEATVTLGRGARLVWREEVVLGRHREAPGSVCTRTTVDRDGTPVLRHELALGPAYPAAASPAVTGGARAVGSVLLAGQEWSGPGAVLGPTAAILPLEAGGGAQVVALADDAPGLRRLLDQGMGAVEGHTGRLPVP
jgi:urease accessory protein